MKQVLQNLRNGQTEVASVPTPAVGPGQVLIRTCRSLISAGTERMLVDFGKAGILGKIRSQPEKVRQVIDKIKTDGIWPALEAVGRKLDQPIPLGYSSVGRVLAVGQGAEPFQPGDRVVSNGPHAEVVAVGKHLVARIPDEVPDEQACFTVVASIALQGIRLVAPTFGERVAVYGLGLIGLLAVQLLRAAGCEVLGIDVDEDRLALARGFGACCVNAAKADVPAAARAWTGQVGVDAVVITASSRSDEIIRNAAEMSRRRGRVVLVGVVGLDLDREPFYKKELTFQVSCSYGPGRYDEQYESGRCDYPIAHVRWTEQRNFQAVLSAMAAGQLNPAPLISHHFPISGAPQAYQTLAADRTALGVVLEYPQAAEMSRTVEIRSPQRTEPGRARVAVIGAGQFATGVLIPALAATGAQITAIASRTGASARHAARKHGALRATTDVDSIFADPETDAVVIATRPASLAALACRALAAGKHTFVEKPLALNDEQLREVVAAARSATDRVLMVGYNRRFSPHTAYLAEQVQGRAEPISLQMTVNAGQPAGDSWICDASRNGERIVSEGCHFIDLMRFLVGRPIRQVSAVAPQNRADQTAILLGFADGSTGTLNYLANGTKRYPKEELVVFAAGRVHRLENFRRTRSWTGRGCRTRRQNKGHANEMATFVQAVLDGSQPMGLDELVEVSLASFAAIEAARTGRTVDLADAIGEIASIARPQRPDPQVLQSGSWTPTRRTDRGDLKLRRSA